MNYKLLLSAAITVIATQNTFAQFSQDAFRFSNTQPGSTSRIKAIGNASTAVGGDLSSISGNPAGLGFFTHSEFSITPEFDASKNKATYFGQSNSDSKNQGNLNNASVVFYAPVSKPRGADLNKGLLSFNFGASYNRTSNFYSNTYFSGQNSGSSIANWYANLNDGDDLKGFAYNQYLIDPNATNTGYQSAITSGTNTQANRISRVGGQTSFDLAAGANFSNKLYLGLGIGITSLRYDATNTFSEAGNTSITINDAAINSQYVNDYIQDQSTRGTGFNARIGLIYKPIEAVRIGASFTSPTWYSIDDAYGETLQTSYSQDASSPYANSTSYGTSYNLRTPLKASGGLAVFVGKYGFISGDVEYVDYANMHISSGDYDVSQDNYNLKNLYKSTVNTRVGAEAKIDAFFIRGGFNYQGNPQKGDVGSAVKISSAGLGYRFGTYYIDATYQYVTGSSRVYPYELGASSPYASVKNTYNNAFLTLGTKF